MQIVRNVAVYYVHDKFKYTKPGPRGKVGKCRGLKPSERAYIKFSCRV